MSASDLQVEEATLRAAVGHARQQVQQGKLLSAQDVQHSLGIGDDELSYVRALCAIRDELAALLDTRQDPAEPVVVDVEHLRRLVVLIDQALR